jgi:hypothetical protein
MEFKKVIFRLKPIWNNFSKRTNLPKMILANQPIIIFDHNLNKVMDYDNMSHDCIESFNTIFNDIYKSKIKTKFHKYNQFDLSQSQTNSKFIGYNQIEHIDIRTDNEDEQIEEFHAKSNIRCYILDLHFIESSIVIDQKLNMYHQILNYNQIQKIQTFQENPGNSRHLLCALTDSKC